MSDSDVRFARLALALGDEAVAKLNAGRVAVIGIGGVGCAAAEMLARSAVGHLVLVDVDTFQQTDMNRQLFALESTLGKPKVDAAADRIRDINPSVLIDTHHAFFHTDTADALLTPPPDFVIDAIDAVLPKVELISYCITHGIPVISVMGAAVRRDYSRIHVADLKKTHGCPLARVIRRRLKRRGITRGVPCVFSSEPGPPLIQPEDVTDDALKTGHTRGRRRPVLGSYGPFINIFGILAADYVIREISNTTIDS